MDLIFFPVGSFVQFSPVNSAFSSTEQKGRGKACFIQIPGFWGTIKATTSPSGSTGSWRCEERTGSQGNELCVGEGLLCYQQGFSASALWALGTVILCCGGCPVHCRIVQSFASPASTCKAPLAPQLPRVTTQKAFRLFQKSPGEQKYPLVENH